MPENCALIIDMLIEQRHNKKMTQKDLAKAANLAQPAIARLESKAATPKLDTLLKVAAALDFKLELVPVYCNSLGNEKGKTEFSGNESN